MRRINIFVLMVPLLAVSYVSIFVSNEYYLSVAAFVLINAVNVTAFNILLGYTGIISLGQAAFFGLGAYTAGVLSVNYGIDPFITIFFGIIIAIFFAVLVGIPALRLHGHYLAMATLGFCMVIYILLLELNTITGGVNGLYGIEFMKLPGGFVIDDEKKSFIMMSVYFMILLLFFELFDKSHYSYKLKYIKYAPSAAEAYGVNIARTKVIIFAAMAGITALNGGMYAYLTQFIAPDSFGFEYSVELIAMAVVGGLGSIAGGLIGAVALSLIPYVFAIEGEMLIYGVFMATCVMFFPDGIAGIASQIGNKLKSRSSKKSADDKSSEVKGC